MEGTVTGPNTAFTVLFYLRFLCLKHFVLLNPIYISRFHPLYDYYDTGYNLYSASGSNIYAVIESRVLKPIRGEGRLINNHMRFRAFVCLCISRGIFLQWMTDLPLLKGELLYSTYCLNSLSILN